MPPALPHILTIAGSDSSCGAGVQADLKAVSALGGYALNALTSVVSESPGRVSQVVLLEPGFVADQIRILFEAFPIAAAKTGMLGGKGQVEAVVASWRQQALPQGIPLVVDPVMVATGGGKLLEDDAIDAVRQLLLPLATLMTPNMDEAAVLWGRPLTSRDSMEECAAALAAEFQTSVLLKGGHLAGEAADCLFTGGQAAWFESPRIAGVQTHGTGCTYSAAIATLLGQGMSLHAAVGRAKEYVTAAIAGHYAWQGPRGTVHALNHLQH